MRYFEVDRDNLNYASRWFLGNPSDMGGQTILGENFCFGSPYCGPSPVFVPIDTPGRSVAFHFAALSMPVVNNDVARIVQDVAPDDAAFLQVLVGHDESPGFLIMNVLHAEPCLDANLSDVMWWKEEDGRPERTGKPRMVLTLVVDQEKTAGRHILRVKDWEVALLVSETLRDALIKNVAELGVVFHPVTK